MTISTDEDLLAPARKARWGNEFRQRYRQRAQVERKNAQLKSRNAKLPWRGLAKADAWLNLLAAQAGQPRQDTGPHLLTSSQAAESEPKPKAPHRFWGSSPHYGNGSRTVAIGHRRSRSWSLRGYCRPPN